MAVTGLRPPAVPVPLTGISAVPAGMFMELPARLDRI
jgi:hypothetical protein